MSDEHDKSNLRRYADRELAPDEAAGVERALSDDPLARDLVEGERQLRSAVARIAESDAPRAPDDVVNRVRAALAGPSRSAPPAPRRVNAFAVAATLALVSGAVLYGIFGPRIDDQPVGRSDNLLVEDAIWASTEHDTCTGDRSHRSQKLHLRAADDVERELGAWLGVPAFRVFDLSEFGYVFAGGGHCMVPGPERSGHLMYARSGDAPAMVSIFVVPDGGQFGSIPRFDPKEQGWIEIEGGPQCRLSVLNRIDDDLVYFLVCCDEADLQSVARRIAWDLDQEPGTGG